MLKKQTVFFLTFLFMNFLLLEVLVAAPYHDPMEGGWLEERDGVSILHISGSPYNMGFQHGFLLQDEIQENYRAIFNHDT